MDLKPLRVRVSSGLVEKRYLAENGPTPKRGAQSEYPWDVTLQKIESSNHQIPYLASNLKVKGPAKNGQLPISHAK